MATEATIAAGPNIRASRHALPSDHRSANTPVGSPIVTGSSVVLGWAMGCAIGQ